MRSDADDLARDIHANVSNHVDTAKATEPNEVFVRMDGTGMSGFAGMDNVIAIAYDHGYVPTGITHEAALRLVPRDHPEVRV